MNTARILQSVRLQAGPCFAREQLKAERGAVDAQHQRPADGAAERHYRRAAGVQREHRARDAARHRGVDLGDANAADARERSCFAAAASQRGRGTHQAAFAVAHALQLLQRRAVDGHEYACSVNRERRLADARRHFCVSGPGAAQAHQSQPW